jgi:hypothetical protein
MKLRNDESTNQFNNILFVVSECQTIGEQHDRHQADHDG